jgi:hypothetical protein
MALASHHRTNIDSFRVVGHAYARMGVAVMRTSGFASSSFLLIPVGPPIHGTCQLIDRRGRLAPGYRSEHGHHFDLTLRSSALSHCAPVVQESRLASDAGSFRALHLCACGEHRALFQDSAVAAASAYDLGIQRSSAHHLVGRFRGRLDYLAAWCLVVRHLRSSGNFADARMVSRQADARATAQDRHALLGGAPSHVRWSAAGKADALGTTGDTCSPTPECVIPCSRPARPLLKRLDDTRLAVSAAIASR